MKLLRKLADNRQSNSFAAKLRRKRFGLFRNLVSSLDPPFNILDVGGTELFWKAMDFCQEHDVRIVLLNVPDKETTGPEKAASPNFTRVVGDARDMKGFKDKEFDVVFSNSVIEHVGDYHQQRRMAEEVRRVGKRYFVQTPNRFFPIEPHFLFPFFQFLPSHAKVFLVRHFDLGFYAQGKIPNLQEAAETVNSIRLLTERELRILFPGATIYREKFLGLTKSLIAYEGFV